jgi:hypothetical protein
LVRFIIGARGIGLTVTTSVEAHPQVPVAGRSDAAGYGADDPGEPNYSGCAMWLDCLEEAGTIINGDRHDRAC